MKCCLCGKEIPKQYDLEGKMIWDKGHNAAPLEKGRCCSDCNITKVIPIRMKGDKK